jgi:NAD(P)-dependent dehydrogenase (short-subunit alcohol dehydrogenase family)
MNPAGAVVVEPSRSVVVTGASRGLGLATAAHLYRRGWSVVAGMRTPDVGMKRLAERLGAPIDERRLVGVRLDLDDPQSIADAASSILDRCGAPDGIVHNAGVAGVGAVEEMPVDVVEGMFSTNLFGPIRLTQHLLPAMRTARRGRIVVVSSAGGVRGMPAISSYSASKGALERWAESASMEVSRFGIGVTVLVAGTFKTDILELTSTWKDEHGAYARMHAALEAVGEKILRVARSPERFAPAVERALVDSKSFARRPVGIDAALLLYANRVLPARTMQSLITRALGLPRK